MHSMDNYYVSKLIPLMAEAGLGGGQSAHQHHHPGPPRHLPQAARPDARARAAGITVGFGHDRADPWYSLGSADMLEVAAMGPARGGR